jgi:hypothetical protein
VATLPRLLACVSVLAGIAMAPESTAQGGSVPATYQVFGTGCPGSAGTLTIAPGIAPRIGRMFSIVVLNAPPNQPGFLIAAGRSDRNWGLYPLPLPLDPIGLNGCFLYASGENGWMPLPASPYGAVVWGLQVPDDARLVGVEIFQQAFFLDPGTNAAGMIASNGGRGRIGSGTLDPRIVFWNTLGSDRELANSVVGPAVTALQPPARYVPTGGIRGSGMMSDNDDPIARFPSSVLSTERGTLCLWFKLIGVPGYYPNATDHDLVHVGNEDLQISFSANDGLGHSGWIGILWRGHRTYSDPNCYGIATTHLGANGQSVHIALVWDRVGVPGFPGEKVVVYRNGLKVSTYVEHGPSWQSAWTQPVELNRARFNPAYASGTIDLDLAYDDIRVYSATLTSAEILALYQAEL